LGAMLALMAVSAYYPNFTLLSLNAIQTVFFGTVWFLILVTYVDKDNVNWLLDAICVIALCNSTLMIFQVYDYNLGWIWESGVYLGRKIPGAMGLMSQPNETSALLGICVPAFFRKKRWWFLPLVAVGLALSVSYGGVLAALVSCGVISFTFFNKKWFMGVFFGLVVLGLLYNAFIDQPKIASRFNRWEPTLKLYAEKPIMGHGLSHWRIIWNLNDVHKKYKTSRSGYMHNDIIQGLFESGIGFAIILIGYLASVARRVKRKSIVPVAALVGILTSCGSFFTFHIATTAMIALTWIAVLEIELNDTRESY
jgi:hypothetical protein